MVGPTPLGSSSSLSSYAISIESVPTMGSKASRRWRRPIIRL